MQCTCRSTPTAFRSKWAMAAIDPVHLWCSMRAQREKMNRCKLSCTGLYAARRRMRKVQAQDHIVVSSYGTW